MAEVAVSIAMDKLINFVSEDFQLLRGVHKEVEDIKLEFEFIQSFLKEADSRANNCSGVNTWVKLVRETAFRIEDALDDYLLHLHVVDHHVDQRGFKAFMGKLASFLQGTRKRHEIASELRDIKRAAYEIGLKRKRYGFNISEKTGVSKTRVDHSRVGLQFVEDEALVGVESHRNELVKRLVCGSSTRAVISVVGMGGVGKTTLVRKVYENEVVVGYFDYHAWITVSQSFDVGKLLKAMLRRFCDARKELPPYGIDQMDGEELISKCREYLRDKRYVVVFDDVWNEDFWLIVECILVDNSKGCRIMITTRNGVAEFCKKSSIFHVHDLKPLPLELAHELLCRTAFRFDLENQCPLELKELSLGIVRRCEGLPLAIVAIGGLLLTKGKDVSQWEILHKRLSAEFEDNPHLSYIKKILSFSYFDLPHHLKSCFLYFGMFPEDYSIDCGRLTRLWIAEGFVKRKQSAILEEVAREYLTELVPRNLVQFERIDSMGRVRQCRVHDLMHEVILSKCEELNLIQTSSTNLLRFKGTARYLSVTNRANKFPGSVCKSQTHSIIVFEVDDLPESILGMLLTNFKFLKQLDFKGIPLIHVPEELGNLLQLRYLSLRDTKVKMLPNSIGNLYKLQTLDLKRSLVRELPNEVNKLHNLQYLVVYCTLYDSNLNLYSRQGVKMCNSLANLVSLEKLFSVKMETQEGDEFFIELGRLKQLRKLGINKLRPKHGVALCAAIQQMPQLESLSISSIKDDEYLQLQSMSDPPILLQRLCLRGRLTKLPHWVSKLHNLVRIGLHWSRVSDDSLEILGHVPNLLKLQLTNNGFQGAQLHFRNGYFKKLKELELRSLNGLKRLIMDEEALPVLQVLSIGPSPELEELPWRISRLDSLKFLSFHNIPNGFARKLLPDEGSDYWKVKHIPNVVFYCTSTQCYAYKLGDQRLLQVLR